MTRHDIPLSHLFFANDLILYAKASVDQAQVVKGILDEFGVYSGHRTTKFPVSVCVEIDKIVYGFIWGSSTSTRKISLVNWSAISQPRGHSGLGIPRSNERNLAFMQKLAFSLVSSPDAMWVAALHQKYHMFSTCPLSISRPNCSPIWRALSNVWDIVRKNIFWFVGDGNDVYLWNDTWLLTLGPPRPWASLNSSNIDNLYFEDLLLDDGGTGSNPFPGLVYSFLFYGNFGSDGMTSLLMVTVSLSLTYTRLVLLGSYFAEMLWFLFPSAWVLLVVFFGIPHVSGLRVTASRLVLFSRFMLSSRAFLLASNWLGLWVFSAYRCNLTTLSLFAWFLQLSLFSQPYGYDKSLTFGSCYCFIF
ncbi:hypothetical protein V6N11_018724 [Hibiscus sabdariffa]|uniref:Reverse transcriptase domain-containing protein n=1 Tax=Hibiscus sabdariffa TaxID=183260 RepID=A0ABR2QT29_9ROSI